MNNHPDQIKFQDSNWSDTDWYNRTNAQGSRYRDLYINECGYMALENDAYVNTMVDCINRSSSLIHHQGVPRSVKHREQVMDSMRDILDMVETVFDGR